MDRYRSPHVLNIAQKACRADILVAKSGRNRYLNAVRHGIMVLGMVSALTARAQYEDLLNNPDIIWLAEYTSDFRVNPENEYEDLYAERLNYLDILQFRNSGGRNGLFGITVTGHDYLSRQLLVNARLPGFLAYRDSSTRQLMTPDEIFHSITQLDTVITCDDCPKDEPRILINEVTSEQICCLRIRQVFWYDRKSKTFNGRLLAYAPVIYTKDAEGNWSGTKVLFWIQADNHPPGKFKNKDFNYVFQTKMQKNAPGLEDFSVLKGSFDFRKFFADELNAPSHPFLSSSDYLPISASVLSADCFGADTAITYTPEDTETPFSIEYRNCAGCLGKDTIINYTSKTYKENITLQYRNCIAQIENIRFIQNWYYDERRGRLYARLIGIAPLAAIRDEEGSFRYFKPLFYQMYR